MIAACEWCRPTQSDHLFDSGLADVIDKYGALEFAMAEPARCPNCKGEISEKTLVEAMGGTQIEEPAPK